MKKLISLTFMVMVIGYMSVGFAENAYNSIEEIKLDGEEAINKIATLELEYFELNDRGYEFFDGYNFITFEKDAKFKEIIRSIIRAKVEGDAKGRRTLNPDYYHIKYFITFKIIGFQYGKVFGSIIKINDSENEPME